jgi:transcriptional regulator with XRE-family HTH domain
MISIKDEELINAFGSNVRSIRKEKGITMERLAELAGVEYTQIANIERGKVNTTISTASAIAKGLKVPLFRLFKFD